MSLKDTLSTEHWNTIPKKCKNCGKAIYTKEDVIYYQCSVYGKFKKDCELETSKRVLLKPQDIQEK